MSLGALALHHRKYDRRMNKNMVRSMSFRYDNLQPAAKSLISEYGSNAASEAKRRASHSTKKGLGLTASAWRKIHTIIVELQQDKPGQRSRV